jgi:general secretion pathway protein G
MHRTRRAIDKLKAKLLARVSERCRRHALPGARVGERGMTLLEIMIVLALIGLVMGSLGLALSGQFKKGQIKTARIAVGSISNAAQQYMMENNSNCPTSLDDLVAAKNLPKKQKDPWGKDFLLKCPGTGDPDGVDVSSSGPDKQEGTADDIKSWDK